MALLGIALHAGLGLGPPDLLPAGLRVALAFVAFILLPGHALLAAVGVLPPGGRWLASGWALGLGVAWCGTLILVTRALHLPFTVLTAWGAPLNALPWLLAARFGRHAGAPGPGLSRVALAAVLLAALLAGLHVARLGGPPVTYYTDSPDHIGTIRRMMAEGDAFPRDAFFRDAGRAGADPRKGLWHPCVALIATLARTDARTAWCALAALLAPLFVINAAAFAFLLGGGTAAALGAWALLLTYGGSLGTQYLREAVFATKLADQLALATAAAVLADLAGRSARTRLAAVGLALGALAGHVFAALQFASVFGALAAGMAVRDRGVSPAVRRLLATSALLGAALLPYLLWRAHGSYAPINIIHTEPQGLLELRDGMRIVSPGVLWDWTGALWLLFPLSWFAWARQARNPAVLYLLTSSVLALLVMFFPPLVSLLEPRVGYLLMRFVWLLPVSGAVACTLVLLAGAVRAGRHRVPAGAALVVVLALLAPALADGVRAFGRPTEAERHANLSRWAAPLAWLDRNLPQGSVVLSDPATSYAIPMATRHWVMTLLDQHSSPNDPLALTRILDARDALDPWGSWTTTRAVIRRWGVTAIALNNRLSETPRLDYWAPDPAWFTRARARFDAQPTAFPRVFDTGDFVVYRIENAALAALPAGAPVPPYRLPWNAAFAAGTRRQGPGLPDMVDARLGAAHAPPGGQVPVRIDWHAPRQLAPGAYEVAVRFDRELPRGFAPVAWLGKPARKLLERSRHERYRFRADHLPIEGDYGVDRWRADEVVRDSFAITVPADSAPGAYRAEIRMLRQPHYPNYRLGDFFFDHDYYSGLPIGTLVVDRAAAH